MRKTSSLWTVYIYRPGLIDTGPLTEEADSYVVITFPAPWLARCPTRSPFPASSVAITFPVIHLFSCHYSFCPPPLLLSLFSTSSTSSVGITFPAIHLFSWQYFFCHPPLPLLLYFRPEPLLLPLLFPSSTSFVAITFSVIHLSCCHYFFRHPPLLLPLLFRPPSFPLPLFSSRPPDQSSVALIFSALRLFYCQHFEALPFASPVTSISVSGLQFFRYHYCLCL